MELSTVKVKLAPESSSVPLVPKTRFARFTEEPMGTSAVGTPSKVPVELFTIPAGRLALFENMIPVVLNVVVVPAEASTPIEPLIESAKAKDDEAVSTAPRARICVKLFITASKKPQMRSKSEM